MELDQAAQNGHQHPEPPQPDPAYAIQALQAEVARLRGLLGQSEDTKVYLSAMLAQIQAEAQAEISNLTAEKAVSSESRGQLSP